MIPYGIKMFRRNIILEDIILEDKIFEAQCMTPDGIKMFHRNIILEDKIFENVEERMLKNINKTNITQYPM